MISPPRLVGASSIPPQHQHPSGKHPKTRYGQQLNRMPVGLLDGKRCGPHVVSTLRAALSAGGACGERQRGDQEQEKFHWKNSSRMKRNIQSPPMACQYQTVVSTQIWRVANWREARRLNSAATRATRPRNKWTACATVMM